MTHTNFIIKKATKIVIKRTMFSTRQLSKVISMQIIRPGINVSGNSLQTRADTLVNFPNPKKDYASYRVAITNCNTSSHELAQANPILTSAKGKAFQHPSYVRDICDKDEACESKVCAKPCGIVNKSALIGHGTHDGTFPNTVFLSSTDLNNNLSPQYGKLYENPLHNHDSAGILTDNTKTNNLTTNTEMLNNLHMKAKPYNSQTVNKIIYTVDNENIN